MVKNQCVGKLPDIMKLHCTGYVMHDCKEAELIGAIDSAIAGKPFMCKRITALLNNHPDKTSGIQVLSDREVEIIIHIAGEYSNKMIADKLNLSTHTVSTHRKNIMRKLGVSNTAGIVMYAVRNHFVNPCE